jgi:hypothetical protein
MPRFGLKNRFNQLLTILKKRNPPREEMGYNFKWMMDY